MTQAQFSKRVIRWLAPHSAAFPAVRYRHTITLGVTQLPLPASRRKPHIEREMRVLQRDTNGRANHVQLRNGQPFQTLRNRSR